jgi:hypothetical protein
MEIENLARNRSVLSYGSLEVFFRSKELTFSSWVVEFI